MVGHHGRTGNGAWEDRIGRLSGGDVVAGHTSTGGWPLGGVAVVPDHSRPGRGG